MYQKTIMHKLPMVYVIVTQDFKHIKIGMTVNIKGRMRNIRSGCPFKIHLWTAAYTHNPRQLEKELHDEFSEYKTEGEWFTIPDHALDLLVDRINKENIKTRGVISALL